MHKCLYFLDVPYDDVTISAMDIPLAKPFITETEHKYVTDALRKNQISGSGEYIEKCEGLLAKYTSREHAVLVANGTVALHLALLTLNIGPGDEVIVPAFGYVAFANAVKYVGAKPILVDIENETLGLDPIILEAKITSRTKAILVVHNYGLLGKIDIILDIANKYDIPIIEDAAEALGGKFNNQKAGSFGIISTYSFYGNKIATSGEGGAVLTDDATLAGYGSRN
jgi:perosamine synthetase